MHAGRHRVRRQQCNSRHPPITVCAPSCTWLRKVPPAPRKISRRTCPFRATTSSSWRSCCATQASSRPVRASTALSPGEGSGRHERAGDHGSARRRCEAVHAREARCAQGRRDGAGDQAGLRSHRREHGRYLSSLTVQMLLDCARNGDNSRTFLAERLQEESRRLLDAVK